MVKVIDTLAVKRSWPVMEGFLRIHNQSEYQSAVATLNRLLDEIGNNETHPLYGFLEVLGALIEHYEEEHIELKRASGIETLKYLMEEHHLRQNDLPEIGSQGVVSEILKGKRQLNVHQIRKLSERFKVSPAVFFD